MKANNMTCTDYRTVQDEKLVLWLPGASMEDALGMETDIIRIQTDAGDEVEALCGFSNLVSVTYVAESNTMVVTLTRKADDGVGAALDALGAENVRLRTENAKMSEHINQLEDCILELSDSVYGEETAE